MTFEFSHQWSYYPLFSAKPFTTGNSISGDITITLYPLWYKQITIQWSIPATWGVCTFNVYKSEVETNNFKKLNAVPLTGTYLKDITTQDFSKFFHSWFIVEAVLPSGKRVQSKAITWENTRNSWVELRAQEIQRREYILLRKFTGVATWVLRKKTYGQRCRECWNFELEKVMKDKCVTCMGTSFEGGYFDAVQTFLQYDPSPNDLIYDYFGKWEKNDLPAWTIAFPEVRARDLIYRVPDAALFVIEDRANTELQAVTVRQILMLRQLDRESPEYRLISVNNLIPAIYQT